MGEPHPVVQWPTCRWPSSVTRSRVSISSPSTIRAYWEFRSRLDAAEFAIADVTDEEWDAFHTIIAEG